MDESHFRDTAHGLLAWAVASLVTAALLTSAIGTILGAGVQAGATVAGGIAKAAPLASMESTSKVANDAMAYWVDSMFRRDMTGAVASASAPLADSTNANLNLESSRIFANAMTSGALAAEDVRYLGQWVSLRTGLSQPEAQRRVSESYKKMQTKMDEVRVAALDAADKARKVSAHTSLWLVVSLLIGAFTASLCATFGGRQRDDVF